MPHITIQKAEERVEKASQVVEECERKLHAATTLAEELRAERALRRAKLKLAHAISALGLVRAWNDPEKAAKMNANKGAATPARLAQREAARKKAASPEARKKAWETRRKRRDEKLAQPTSDSSDQVPG